MAMKRFSNWLKILFCFTNMSNSPKGPNEHYTQARSKSQEQTNNYDFFQMENLFSSYFLNYFRFSICTFK
jgi:hypothetical protein